MRAIWRWITIPRSISIIITIVIRVLIRRVRFFAMAALDRYEDMSGEAARRYEQTRSTESGCVWSGITECMMAEKLKQAKKGWFLQRGLELVHRGYGAFYNLEGHLLWSGDAEGEEAVSSSTKLKGAKISDYWGSARGNHKRELRNWISTKWSFSQKIKNKKSLSGPLSPGEAWY